MSDLAEQFYTAWVASFGNRPHKLVCMWHVDRAWRETLRQLKDSELEATVYRNLRVLLEETDRHKFELLLDQKNLPSPPLLQTLVNTLKLTMPILKSNGQHVIVRMLL